METQPPGKRQVWRIVEQILSTRRDQRATGLRMLQSLSSDDRLAVEEAVLSSISWDSKPGYGVIWFAAVVCLWIFAFNPYCFVCWLCVLGMAGLACRAERKKSNSREEILCTLLDLAGDKRLIPEMLACRIRMAARWDRSSGRCSALIAALERLFPCVSSGDVANLHPSTRSALLYFLVVPPRHPMITLEVLRLAPHFGDSKVLESINRLAAHPEWGGSVSADLCFQLHSAAVAAQSALRSAIEQKRQASGLLRASEEPVREDASELLRSATGGTTSLDSELLRPELPAVCGTNLIASEQHSAMPETAVTESRS